MSDKKKVTIVDAIRTSSIAVLVPMIDKYPILMNLLNSSESDNPSEEWNFFMTSAGAGIVLLSTEAYKGEHKEVESTLEELGDNYIQAVNDLSGFVEKPKSGDIDLLASIGYWVLWNVKKTQPTDEEIQQLSLIIGNYLVSIIADWRKTYS